MGQWGLCERRRHIPTSPCRLNTDRSGRPVWVRDVWEFSETPRGDSVGVSPLLGAPRPVRAEDLE